VLTHRFYGFVLILGCIALLPAGAARAQPSVNNGAGSPSVRIRRTDRPPVIDGVLNDAAWSQAAVIDDFHQVNPVEFAEPSEKTEVFLTYDNDALYIAARLYDDDPSAINARILRQNQPIGPDDRFFIHIDPLGNRRSGYLFGVNPNGVRFDGVFENVTQHQFDWDGIWEAQATIDDKGWVVEVAIPFKTLSFDPSNDTWRMNFNRHIARKNESISWVSRNRNTDLTTMGDVIGISGIEQGMGLDVVPSLTVRERNDFATSATDSRTKPSLDAFYKVTPSLTAALTVNTDFSATEVDDRQINLTRFSLFFPEKRDFFLQDVDIFQFGRLDQNGRPFFSRKLGISADGVEVPIDYGAKLSGRIGRWDVGALSVRQQAYEGIDATTAFVGRVAANVLPESSVGMIATKGDPTSNLDNSVLGVDFRYINSRLPSGRSVEGEFWYQQSDTENLIGDDAAAGIRVRLPNNTAWRGGFGATRIGQNFNPALGFVSRAGIGQYQADFGYTFRPEEGPIRTMFSGIDVDRIEYADNGDVQSESLNFRLLNVQFDSQNEISLGYSKNEEGLREPFEISSGVVLPAATYAFDEYDLSVRTGRQNKVGGGFFFRQGEFYSGTRRRVAGFLGWRPSPHFRSNLEYQVNDVSLPQGDFTTRLVRIELETVFSSTLSWVNLIQYDNVTNTAGINSRLHWIPEAGREGYLVLNRSLEDVGGRFRSTASEASIKFSYTFRF
jgi:hypothetical protein